MATAYAALVSLLNNLDLIQHHPLHSFSFENKQIESLLATVLHLIHFMEASDYHGGAAEDLERRIACAAHAAEDVIESHVVDQITGGSTLGWKAKPSCFLPDLQKATEDMESVRREAIKVQKSQSGFKAEQPTFSATNLTSQKNTMVGFDEELHQLVDLLTGEANRRRVIPIVGMGGIGKTTLARNALQHKLIMEHFDVCLWATISQQYDVKAILSQLLSCVSEPTSGNVAELGVRLRKCLYGRRYLIILDDMWSLDVWDEIKFYFPADKDSMSRIVVTSRQQDVADHLTSSPCFPLHLLDKDKSWDLFCEKAFGEEGCPLELEEVGYKIVRKCKGLPLAIIVVGGHLRKSPKTQEYWENVANHMDSILRSGENEERCLDILSLSYSCLPIYLKPCFLYMGMFEEDEWVSAATLIKLWIGEGFLKPSKTHLLEEVAEGYLKDLVDRNLILACQRDLNGKVVSCVVHDIVRELCLKIVEKEEFLCVVDAPRPIHRERRVVIRGSISSYEMHKSFHALTSALVTRSLKCNRGLRFLGVSNGVDGSFMESDFHQVNSYEMHKSFDALTSTLVTHSLICNRDLRLLRVSNGVDGSFMESDFHEVGSYEMHKSFDALTSTLVTRSPKCKGRWSYRGLRFLRVSNGVDGSFMESDFHQVNLRYLDCFIPEPFYFSPSISLLWSLQTIILKPSVPSLGAPYEFWEMLQLRHLEIKGIHLPDPLSSDGDRLVLANLQTLKGVTNFRLSEEVCKRVSNIKELQIKYTYWDSEYDDAHYCLHNLSHLHKLESLSCTFSTEPGLCDVARSLTFPNSLKELSLTESRLHWEELSMMVGSLSLLEVLNLSSNAVVGSELNAVEGEFIRLKSLTVSGCADLVNFNADGSHFPALTDLTLSWLPEMDELPSSIGEMASLRRIRLSSCRLPLAVSAMRMLVEQEQEFGNEQLQLTVTFGGDSSSHKIFQDIMREEGLSSNNLLLYGNWRILRKEEVPDACRVM